MKNASEQVYYVATNAENPLAVAILEQLSLKCRHFVKCQKVCVVLKFEKCNPPELCRLYLLPSVFISL
jgi:hypothetical protein